MVWWVRKRTLFAVISICSLVFAAMGSAVAVTRDAENALRHAGEIMALVKLCDSLKINETAISIVLVANGADLNRPEHMAIARNQAMSDLSAWADKNRDSACLAGLMLYGPTGSTIPGLLRLTR